MVTRAEWQRGKKYQVYNESGKISKKAWENLKDWIPVDHSKNERFYDIGKPIHERNVLHHMNDNVKIRHIRETADGFFRTRVNGVVFP